MNPVFRISTGSLLIMVLGLSCNNNDKNSSTSSSTTSCSFKKEGELMLCTQYEALAGSTLTSIQSECELRSTEGYSWAAAACPATTIGSCSLAATPQKAAPSIQYYYGATFATQGTAEGMCTAQGGTFK